MWMCARACGVAACASAHSLGLGDPSHILATARDSPRDMAKWMRMHMLVEACTCTSARSPGMRGAHHMFAAASGTSRDMAGWVLVRACVTGGLYAGAWQRGW
jgi:hypothetical protein